MSNWIPRMDKLDPVQREFINNYRGGNVCLHGYPGSGKSILLVYLLRRLLQEQPNLDYDVVSFTHALADLFRTGFHELGMGPYSVPVMTQFELKNNNRMYDYIFCDEIQDLSPETLRMIKSRARKSVIAAGDTNQSIYSKDPLFNTPTIIGNQASQVLDATVVELNIIYRLTRSVIEAVKRLMPKMAANWTAKNDIEHADVQIRLRKEASVEDECRYIYTNALEVSSNEERTAVLLPTHKEIITFVNQVLVNNGKTPWSVRNNAYGSKPDYDAMNTYLKAQGIKMMYVGSKCGSLYQAEQQNLIVVMTYASSKGLDFVNVYMPFLTRDLRITQDAEKSKTTFMVAMTRSSLRLMMSYTDKPTEYLSSFSDTCSFRDMTRNQNISGRSLFG